MSFKFNPLTGLLDFVGDSGSGSSISEVLCEVVCVDVGGVMVNIESRLLFESDPVNSIILHYTEEIK